MDKRVNSRAKRFFTIFIVLGMILVSFSPVVTAGLADSQWPRDSHDNQNTGQSQYLGPQNNTTKWNHTFNELEQIASSPIIGPDGTIYLGTNYQNGILYAFNSNGIVKWNYTINDGVLNRITSTPAVASDGTIYLAAQFDDDQSNSHANLYAIINGVTGVKKWNFTVPGTDSRIVSSPAIGSDGTIYFGSTYLESGFMMPREQGIFYALNPDGTVKWNYTITDGSSNGIIGSPAIGPDGTIYFGVDYSYGIGATFIALYALADDGTQAIKKWSYKANEGLYNSIIGSPAIGSDGTIYWATNSFTPTAFSGSSLNALIDNGTSAFQKWSYSLDGITSSPSVASDGTIYFGGEESSKYNLNALVDQVSEAVLKWSFNVPNPVFIAPTIGSDGTVYFGDASPVFTFYGLNPNGTIKWTYETFTSTLAAIAKDGTLYFGSNSYTGNPSILYAIQGPPADLYVKTSADKSCLNVGDILTITFKVGNLGPNIAYDTVLQYMIPEGMKFVKTWTDSGIIEYDCQTNTVIWNLGDVPLGDPNAYLQLSPQKAGKYVITPEISTTSYDPNLSSNIQSATVIVHEANKNITALKTVSMQNTGIPIGVLISAILMLLGGCIISKKK